MSSFGNYQAVYGGIGAVIVLLMWLYFTGWVILLGGEINHLVQRARAERSEPGKPSTPGAPERLVHSRS